MHEVLVLWEEVFSVEQGCVGVCLAVGQDVVRDVVVMREISGGHVGYYSSMDRGRDFGMRKSKRSYYME